jgi:antibiotic biosynthesis monooxygenase (ABM) superfamily enzyme
VIASVKLQSSRIIGELALWVVVMVATFAVVILANHYLIPVITVH